MPDMAIRRADLADAPALHALVESAYRGDSAKKGWTHEADLLGGQRTDQALLREIIADPDQQILVAEDARGLLACVNIVNKGEGVGYLGMLSVSPDLQAGGLGKALIGAAEAAVKRDYAARVMRMTVIKSRSELIAYYERRGYMNTGREEPFPMDDERFGLPKTRDLVFVVLEKAL